MNSRDGVDPEIVRQVSQAGEWMIRAVNALGRLNPEQRRALRGLTSGGLPDFALIALESAARVAPEIELALAERPPSY